MANTVSVAFASQDLTLTANLANADTVTIGGKVYTAQTTLTDVDGNVLIGATAEATIDNLVAGINLGAGAGTLYAASMTRNAHVYAVKVSATVLRVSGAVPGAIGNNVAVAEASVNASWGAANLAGGTGNVLQFIETLIALNQINAEVLFELKKLTPVGD